MVKRRNLLTGLSAALIMTGFGPALHPGTDGGKARAADGVLDGELFGACLNSRFWLRRPGRTSVRLHLIEVADGPASDRLEQFSLRFRGPWAPRLARGLYAVDHAKLGRFLLYIEPGLRDSTGSYYRADFSLVQGSAANG